jgi:hypothetical protein
MLIWLVAGAGFSVLGYGPCSVRGVFRPRASPFLPLPFLRPQSLILL